MRKYLISLLVLASLVSFAGAQQSSDSPINSVQDIINVILKVLRWMQIIFWIFAAGAIFYAGYLYLGAAGDEKRVGKAKNQILYAVIAIAVALIAPGVVNLIRDVLTP